MRRQRSTYPALIDCRFEVIASFRADPKDVRVTLKSGLHLHGPTLPDEVAASLRALLAVADTHPPYNSSRGLTWRPLRVNVEWLGTRRWR